MNRLILKLKEKLFCRILDKRKLKEPFEPIKAELFQSPPDADEFHNNSYYFSCHDMKGNSLLLRHGIRGVDTTEVWLAYKDADGNAYMNEKQLFKNEAAASSVRCVEPEKTWEFSYTGCLTDMQTGESCKAEIKGVFNASDSIFDFAHHLDSRVMAKSIAREKWSKAFFNELQENNQVHYEQPGSAELSIKIGTKETQLSMPAMRDHSFGKREWNYMNRHFWLMGLFEDGSHLNANMVSYPVLSRLETGYYVNDGTVCVEKAKLLGEMPETGVPDEFTYSAKLLGGKEMKVSCRKELVFEFHFNGYTVYEGIGTFELDGKKGRGILEFGFNDDSKRAGAAQ